MNDNSATKAIITGYSSIGVDAFKDCTVLTDVDLGTDVTSIGNDAFSGCTNLHSVIIPETVTSMGTNVFANTSQLHTAIIYSNATMNGTFYNGNLYRVDFIGSPIIGANAFNGCSYLTNVIFHQDGPSSIDSTAFSNIHANCIVKYGSYAENISILTNYRWFQLGLDIDGEAASDQSGYSVSLSSDGTIVAIGAPKNSGNGSSSGHVRIYQNANSSWTQLGSDIDAEAAWDQSGFSVSLSSDGTIVAIGAKYNAGNGSNSGHIRIHQYANNTWTQLGQDIDGEYPTDYFGWSVSLSSDGLKVAGGSYQNDEAGTNIGHVRIYEYTNNSWSQLGQDIDGEASNDQSGWSISLSDDGTIVAIGARQNDQYESSWVWNSGHVRIYQYANSSWTQLGQDIDGEVGGDQSGHSVSLSSDGTIVAIGAVGNDGNGSNSGHVRVYQYTSGSWTQLGQDIDGEDEWDAFGYSVSISSDGTIVATGGDQNDGNGSNSGHVRIYQYANSNWTQLGLDIDGEAANDQSGYSVSLSSDGTSVAIGAPYNAATDSGHVRVYQYSPLFSQQEILPNSEHWLSDSIVFEGPSSGDYGGVCEFNNDGTIMAHGMWGLGKGQVRVYQKNSSTLEWNQLGGNIETTLQMGGYDSRFGQSLSLSNNGQIISIGALYGQFKPEGVYPGSSVGTVEVFSLNTNNSTWELIGQPLYGQNKYNESSTTDINDDGTIIVIGERNYNTSSDANDPFTYVTNGEGRVRVFYYNTNTSTWDLIGTPHYRN